MLTFRRLGARVEIGEGHGLSARSAFLTCETEAYRLIGFYHDEIGRVIAF